MGTATRRVIGGRATDEQIHLIDSAVVEQRRLDSRLTRADFVIEAAIEKARAVLEAAA